MKRVLLREPEDLGRLNLGLVRRASVAIATWAVGGKERRSGDPVHEWVTEGRRKQYEDALRRGDQWAIDMPAGYSSCGDLWHFVLMLLGCRDEAVVNRNDDGGLVGWAVGRNLTRIVDSRWYVDAEEAEPEEGDLLHVVKPEHASILLYKGAGSWQTADYGQPWGKKLACPISRRGPVTYVRGRRLAGLGSLERMVRLGAFTESAIVPDDFVGGTPDDNPYSEDLRIPPGL
jgi:hypothetical protein